MIRQALVILLLLMIIASIALKKIQNKKGKAVMRIVLLLIGLGVIVFGILQIRMGIKEMDWRWVSGSSPKTILADLNPQQGQGFVASK